MEEQKKGPGAKFTFLMGLFAGMAVIGFGAFITVLVLGNGNKPVISANTNQVVAAAEQGGAVAPTNTTPKVAGVETEQVTASGIKTFEAKAGAQICKENGKPVVYLFSTTWCPHCKWIKDTFDSTVKKYIDQGKIVAYHWELDTKDNTLTSAVENAIPPAAEAVYNEFNPDGSIPTFVFGCKYFRVGNGYEAAQDLNAEKAEFEAAIADLLK